MKPGQSLRDLDRFYYISGLAYTSRHDNMLTEALGLELQAAGVIPAASIRGW